jgi:uncharacterized protein (TIGR04255 family)
MENPASHPPPLALPVAAPAHYARNFIRQAVCELRFPTLFAIDQPRPPLQFATALRKEYPNHDVGNDLNVGVGGVAQGHVHHFRSKRGRWTVSLRPFSIAIETSSYNAFPEMLERIEFVAGAASKMIDSDFYTRVGLRYINAVPLDMDEIAEWINPQIAGALADKRLGHLSESSGRIAGPTQNGGYLLQHGMAAPTDSGKRDYVLDFDFFEEDVDQAQVSAVARQLHELEFAMFTWAIGPKAKAYLGPST